MQQPSTRKVIFKTAVITMAALALACVMVAVIVYLFFPFSGYKFASDLGARRTALQCAERYSEEGNIDGLVYCVELGNELMEKNAERYAKKLIVYTESFFEYESAYEYFAQLDGYYHANAPKQTRVGLYSYYEYVVSSNYVARTVTGEANKMIFRGEPTELNSILDEDLTATEKAIIYSALSKAIAYGKYDLNLLSNGYGFSEFFVKLNAGVMPYLDSLADNGDALETLFFMRSVIHLLDELNILFDNKSLDGVEQWQVLMDYQYNGKSLKAAYTDMFLDYISVN